MEIFVFFVMILSFNLVIFSFTTLERNLGTLIK